MSFLLQFPLHNSWVTDIPQGYFSDLFHGNNNNNFALFLKLIVYNATYWLSKASEGLPPYASFRHTIPKKGQVLTKSILVSAYYLRVDVEHLNKNLPSPQSGSVHLSQIRPFMLLLPGRLRKDSY